MDNAVMGWLHDRIPCLLTTDAEVAAWLDPATPVPAALALLQLPPNDAIAFHPVTTAVGSVKNQDLTLMLPVQLTEAGVYILHFTTHPPGGEGGNARQGLGGKMTFDNGKTRGVKVK